MKSRHVLAWFGTLAGLLALCGCVCGCNGTSTENTELKGQVEQLEASLKETTAQRDALKQDVEKLERSLGEDRKSVV